MFCTQCGRAAQPEHFFCADCGTRLLRAGTPPSVDEPPEFPKMALAVPWTGEDWRETTNYRVVLGHPEVKGLVADAAKASRASMSAEEFMNLAQPVLDASGSGSVPLKLIAEITTPIYAKMGVKTGKDTKNGYATPYGRALAAILCSLAGRNQTLVAIHEGTDGCVMQAEIPSSLTTGKGKLSLTVERKPEGTLVASAVVFEGQSSDWGRSKRVLDDLHQDILNYRSLQP